MAPRFLRLPAAPDTPSNEARTSFSSEAAPAEAGRNGPRGNSAPLLVRRVVAALAVAGLVLVCAPPPPACSRASGTRCSPGTTPFNSLEGLPASFLSKPSGIRELAAAVRRVLDAPAP